MTKIAARLPPWVTSDGLSLLGLSAMVAGGLAFAYVGSARWSAPAVALALLINWFGDSLDGTLARIRWVGPARFTSPDIHGSRSPECLTDCWT